MTKQDEQIDQQQSTSNEEQQTHEQSTQGQSENVEDVNLIPEKFVGKTAYEIAQAYKELERERGRLASELGSARTERESLENRFKSLEAAVSRYNAQPNQSAPAVQREAEKDPLSSFDEQFDEDPKKAIKEVVKYTRDSVTKELQEQSWNERAKEASEYFQSRKQQDKDYARREPTMQELANQFSDVIRPEFLNSKKVMEALDLMSKGRDVDYYTKQAVASVKQNGSAIREEKRRAQSESATSEGEQLKDFSKLSSKEMKALLSSNDE